MYFNARICGLASHYTIFNATPMVRGNTMCNAHEYRKVVAWSASPGEVSGVVSACFML